jgi:serine/threonine protein kinase/Tfp pilus assembly protein PilF
MADVFLGRYRILRPLGSGGMGEVFLARDSALERDVALKRLPPGVAADPTRRARFEREARAVAALDHPNIVIVFSVEEADGVPFFTMQYVEGRTLGEVIPPDGLPLADFLSLAVPLADAASAAHARGILHRDLKPGNVMVTPEGRVKVLDFGLAQVAQPASPGSLTATASHLTGEGHIVGTVAYMSPEQVEGRPLDARSDIFSLGVIFYELLTGRSPFTGNSAPALVAAILRDTPPPVAGLRPDLPPALDAIVHRCLAKDPRSRYQAAASLRDDLDALRQQGEAGPSRQAPSRTEAAVTPARRSVAVLPFLNLSSDPENEFFADGITEDVIAQLSKVRSIKVISRTSAMQFKKREHSLKEIAAKLGVATLVEGSVRRAGLRVRIVAEMIDASTDEQLWAETYDRDLTDIFAIQSDVALSIAGALNAELSPSERTRVERPAAIAVEAYESYLKGRHAMQRLTEPDLRAALGFFERAVAAEPRYAPAHESIAWVYMILGMGHGAGSLKPHEAHAKARDAALRALEADPSYGPGHAMLGGLRFMVDYDWSGGEDSLRRGLELTPNSAFMLDVYGLLLSAQVRFDDAIEVQRRGRELDPLSTIQASDLATTLLRAGRYDEAVREARQLIEYDAAYPLGHSTLGWGRLLGGHPDEGLSELRAAVALSPGNTLLLAQLGQALGWMGKKEEALEVLARLERMTGERYVTPYHFAYVYTGLGEDDRALGVLESAVADRSGGAYGIKGSFLFVTLREHPRFKALLRSMNLDDRYPPHLRGASVVQPLAARATRR